MALQKRRQEQVQKLRNISRNEVQMASWQTEIKKPGTKAGFKSIKKRVINDAKLINFVNIRNPVNINMPNSTMSRFIISING